MEPRQAQDRPRGAEHDVEASVFVDRQRVNELNRLRSQLQDRVIVKKLRDTDKPMDFTPETGGTANAHTHGRSSGEARGNRGPIATHDTPGLIPIVVIPCHL